MPSLELLQGTDCTIYSDYGGGYYPKLADNNSGTACQRMTYFAVRCDNTNARKVVSLLINLADTVSQQSFLASRPVIQYSDNSTNGFNGTWTTLATITDVVFGAGLNSTITWTNDTNHLFYRISHINNFPLITFTELKFYYYTENINVTVVDTQIDVTPSMESVSTLTIIVVGLCDYPTEIVFGVEVNISELLPVVESLVNVAPEILSALYTPPPMNRGGIVDVNAMKGIFYWTDADLNIWWDMGESAIALSDTYRYRTGVTDDASGTVYGLACEKQVNSWWSESAGIYPAYPYTPFYGSWMQCESNGYISEFTPNGQLCKFPEMLIFQATYNVIKMMWWGKSLAVNRKGTVAFCGCDWLYEKAEDNMGAVTGHFTSGSSGYNMAIIPDQQVIGEKFGDAVAISTEVDDIYGVFILAASTTRKPVGGTDRGAVYVFNVQSSVPCEQTAEITAFDGADGDKFGHSLAMNGDGTVLVVGAPYKDNIYSNEGCIYTYDFVVDEWVFRNKTFPPAPALNGLFGSALAISSDGNILYVGQAGVGKAYRFDLIGDVWSPISEMVGVTGGFGRKIATQWDGNLTCISSDSKTYTYYMNGLPLLETNLYTSTYRDLEISEHVLVVLDIEVIGISIVILTPPVIIVEHTCDSIVIDTHPLLPEIRLYSVAKVNENPLLGEYYQDSDYFIPEYVQPNSRFGISISYNQDNSMMLVGSPGHDGKGAVFVYDIIDESANLRGIIAATNGAVGDDFGCAVSLNAEGNKALIGASGKGEGYVYLFQWYNNTWLESKYIHGVSIGDKFGSSVKISPAGDIIMVGAINIDNIRVNQGGVYSYYWDGASFIQIGDVLFSSDATINQNFGSSIAVNEAFTLCAVGTPNRSFHGSNKGGVQVFKYIDNMWVQCEYVIAPKGELVDLFFGSSIGMNKQGTIIAVGANGFTRSHVNQGGVYIFDWTGIEWKQRGDVIVSDTPITNAYFGSSLVFDTTGTRLSIGAYGV